MLTMENFTKKKLFCESYILPKIKKKNEWAHTYTKRVWLICREDIYKIKLTLHFKPTPSRVTFLWHFSLSRIRVEYARNRLLFLKQLLSSVQFSRSVLSDYLRPHESQHARPPCPSPTPGVDSNSCPLSRWCHPAISSSVVPFSSCPPSLPASGFFPMSQLFTWGGQSIGVSASASVLPMHTQDWSPSGWTGWISLQSKGPSRVFSNTTVQKHQFFGTQLSSQSNSHIHTRPLEKP